MVTNYSGYNPDPSKGMVGATWDGGGYSTAVGNYTISGPMKGDTEVNPDFDWAKAYSDATGKKPDGTTDTKDTPPTEDPYERAMRLERERVERLRTMNARAIMEGQMAAFGLGGLSQRIITWITEGYDADAVMALVRQSPEYAERFPAMKALQAKGQGISESEYIAYEQSMTAYERMYGLPSGMLSGKDMVTKSLTNGLSAREVEERAVRASASMYQLPQEFRDTMRQYYGIDSGGLTAYFLDPDVASPMLERQYVSAQIGMEGSRQGVGVSSALAESLYQYGVDRASASKGFGDVAAQSGLSAGKGETTTQDTLIKGNMMNDQSSQKQMQRVAQSRVGRFAGGGGFAGDRSGVSGLGTA